MIAENVIGGGDAMREMKKGSLSMLLLSLLKEHPSYGYDLCEQLRERSDGALSFEDGAIYPLLHSFEQQGIVEGFWESETSTEGDTPPGGRKGPRRRYYRLTPHGHSVLKSSLQEWQTFSEGVSRIVGTYRAEFA